MKRKNSGMLVKKIKMKPGCLYSNSLSDIQEIFLTGCLDERFYFSGTICGIVKTNPGSVQVDIESFPDVMAVLDANGREYICSQPDDSGVDFLLRLPRE